MDLTDSIFKSSKMELPTESFQITTALPQEVVELVEEWKKQVAAEYGCTWSSGENDYQWAVIDTFERPSQEQLILWKNASKIVPSIRVRMSGLHRMNTPIGSDWWISFTYASQDWTNFELSVNGVRNQEDKWIPRLRVPIGSTPPEYVEKLHPLMRKTEQLPWQGKEWHIQEWSVHEFMPETGETILHHAPLMVYEECDAESVLRSVRDFLYQYGVVPVKRNHERVIRRQYRQKQYYQQRRQQQQQPQPNPKVSAPRPAAPRREPMKEDDYPPLPMGAGGMIQRRTRPLHWGPTGGAH